VAIISSSERMLSACCGRRRRRLLSFIGARGCTAVDIAGGEDKCRYVIEGVFAVMGVPTLAAVDRAFG
jgi:hypothetical protein